MKLPILLAVAFGVGLGASTGAAVFGAPDPLAPSHASDPAGVQAPAPADTAGVLGVPPRVDSTRSTPMHSMPEASSDSGQVHSKAIATPPPASPIANLETAPAPSSIARPKPDYRQVARIVSSMPKTEAAALLALLPDDEVDGILREVGVRQAAALLTELPKDRAAQLSRRMLHGMEAKP